MNIVAGLSAAIESAFNAYLQRDEQALQRCAALEGKSIAVQIEGLNLKFFFLPHRLGIDVLSQYEGDVDTRISASPLGLAQLAGGRKADALFRGSVSIEGDSETGQQFEEILGGVEIDWEEQLSRISGDAVAHQAGRLSRSVRDYARDARDSLQLNISEYLQEEARLLPGRAETQLYLDAIDELRADIERLSARIERLATPETDA